VIPIEQEARGHALWSEFPQEAFRDDYDWRPAPNLLLIRISAGRPGPRSTESQGNPGTDRLPLALLGQGGRIMYKKLPPRAGQKKKEFVSGNQLRVI